MTINHSNPVTLLRAHMQRQTHAPTDVIYLVSYCVMLIGISFCNGGEYIGTPWPLSPLFSPRPIITIWLPFIHLCLVCVWLLECLCLCVCVCVIAYISMSRRASWWASEMERLQVLLCAADCSYFHVMGLNKFVFILHVRMCYYADEWMWNRQTDTLKRMKADVDK